MSVDSSSLINNQNTVSSDLLYNLKASTGTSRRYRASIPPSNFSSNIVASSNVIFNIPCGRKNTYLDGQNSYIRITVKNNDPTNTMSLDNTGACLINMLTVFHSGNLIDQCPNYNLLFNYLTDFNYSFAQHVGGQSCYLGTSQNFTGSGDVLSNGTAVAAGATIGNVSKENFANCRSGYTLTSGGQVTLCLPLLCSIFLNSDKMIPLGRLKGDIEFQVLLESYIRSVSSTVATGVAWTILNMELVLEIIELSDTSQIIVDSVSPYDQAIYIHTNQWRYFSNSLPSTSTGQFSSLISARYNSLKTIVCLPQKSSDTISQIGYCLSSRINPNIINYQWRVGSAIMPNKMIVLRNDANTGGFSEGFIEILKSIHGLYNAYASQMVSYSMFNVWDQGSNPGLGISQAAIPTSNLSYQNSFAIAQELEVFSTRNDTILQGLNTIGQNIFHDINIDTTGPSTNYTLNYFANFDVILVIENGIMTAKW